MLLTKSKWYVIFSILLFYLAYALYFGSLREPATNYFNEHPGWYMTPGLLAQLILYTAIGFLFMGYTMTEYYYRHIRFIIDEHAFTLLRGLYFTHETTIPYQQITNVHVYRPIHYKIFGVAKVDIVTAADRSMESLENYHMKKFLVPLIDASLARKLSRFLLRKAAESRNEDVVIEEDVEILENSDEETDE